MGQLFTARRRVHNIAAIVKAYQAEAKRAQRCGIFDDERGC